MNILCIRLSFLIVLFSNLIGYSQNSTEVFHENAFAVRHSFSKKYNTNLELSSRSFMYTNNDVVYKLQQLQISHFSTFKLDLKESIAVGLLYRNRDAFEGTSNEIRLTQQYNIKTISQTLRLGHRFRCEQRFYNNFTAFRFRYRFALDFPLQGLKLDVGESYFVITNEGLFTTTRLSKPELGYRISPSIGILVTQDLNLEVGLELRLSEINIKTRESLFLNTSVELNL